MKKKTLFLFVKQYPLGKMEKYIDHELPFLAREFDRVVLVPVEWFSPVSPADYTSTLPANVSVLDLNGEVKKSGLPARRFIFPALSAWLYEFTRNPHRKYLLRHFRKNTGVLFYQLISASVFGRILERYSGDELYFYTYWFHHATLMLAFLKKQDKIRSFVSRAHSIDLYNEHWLYAGDRHKPLPYAWFKMKYIRKVAAISEHGKEHLLKEFPDCREKISRSYLGVPDNGPGVSLPLQPFVIASCSNFTGNKRVWLIPEILGGLGKDIRWVHFGSGGNTESQVKKAAEKFLSPEQVIFAGHVPTAAIMEYYRTHPVHLFMNMSRAEGLPVSIMEAISFGIPVIATDVYGTPELLSGGNGFLVSADDPVAKIAGLVDQLRNDAQLHKKMGEASRKLFLEKFSAGKTYPDFIRKVLHGLSDN